MRRVKARVPATHRTQYPLIKGYVLGLGFRVQVLGVSENQYPLIKEYILNHDIKAPII